MIYRLRNQDLEDGIMKVGEGFYETINGRPVYFCQERGNADLEAVFWNKDSKSWAFCSEALDKHPSYLLVGHIRVEASDPPTLSVEFVADVDFSQIPHPTIFGDNDDLFAVLLFGDRDEENGPKSSWLEPVSK